MTAVVLTPKGHATFDVEQDGRVLGSIWRYKDGWCGFRHRGSSGYESTDVIYSNADDAIRAIGGRP